MMRNYWRYLAVATVAMSLTACGSDIKKDASLVNGATPNSSTSPNGGTSPNAGTSPNGGTSPNAGTTPNGSSGGTGDLVELAPGVTIDIAAAVGLMPPQACDQVAVNGYPDDLIFALDVEIIYYLIGVFQDSNPLGGEINRQFEQELLQSVTVDTDGNGGTDFAIDFRYDSIGFLTDVIVDTDGNGGTDFSIDMRYDSDNVLTDVIIDTDGNGGTDYSYDLRYDSDGYLTDMIVDTDGNGGTDYSYDLRYTTDLNLMDVLIDTDGNGGTDIDFSYTYDGDILARVQGTGPEFDVDSMCN